MAGAISLPCRTYISRAGNDKTDSRLRRCQDRRNPVSAYTYMELCILHMKIQTAAPPISPLCSKPQNADYAHQSAQVRIASLKHSTVSQQRSAPRSVSSQSIIKPIRKCLARIMSGLQFVTRRQLSTARDRHPAVPLAMGTESSRNRCRRTKFFRLQLRLFFEDFSRVGRADDRN
jgi:hypothetical protein